MASPGEMAIDLAMSATASERVARRQCNSAQGMPRRGALWMGAEYLTILRSASRKAPAC